MSQLETTTELQGDTTAAMLIALCVCWPYGVFWYFDNKEEVVVCPDCKETADLAASTCPHCSEDLDQYRE
jgi:predicted amidophosphoribosyltransferase